MKIELGYIDLIQNNLRGLSYDPYINADSDGYNMIGYFPQASRNYLLGITLGF